MPQTNVIFHLYIFLLVISGCKQQQTAFNASPLTDRGYEVKLGSYFIREIGDRAYQVKDPGDKTTKGGGWEVYMYMVCGTKMALLIDLGNNYIQRL
jgi:hypothetical protein